MDEGSPVDIIYFLDFQKAFDKVPYQRLIPKLKFHGIGINITVIYWIEQWLTDRRQRVVIDGGFKLDTSFELGTTRNCTRAYLVLIYINDLEEGVTSKILKFADQIIIMAEMAVFYVAGYPIEERRRWSVITASPRGQCSK